MDKRDTNGVGQLRQAFDDLVRFETILWAELDARLIDECDMSLGSLNILLVVDATPSCRVFDIAQSLVITVGGTSQAVDRLEKAGWTVRKPHPSDRRSSIVELTAAGQAALARATPIFDRELQRLLRAPLGDSDFTQLAGNLGILRQAASTTTDVGPQRPSQQK